MNRLTATTMALMFAATIDGARADDKDPKALLDAAIQAIGGEEKLAKAQVISWKSKGSVNFGGNEMEFKGDSTARGLDHVRRESVIEGNDGPRTMIMVLGGDRGWFKFGDEPREMEGDALANQTRAAALEILTMTLVPLKGGAYKLATAGESTVEGKPAVGIKVTCPDGKDFTLFLDKQTHLPARTVARMVGFQGEEFTQETTYRDYKDFDGIKKATRVESKRDGEDFIKTEITGFKVLDKVDPKTFSEPS